MDSDNEDIDDEDYACICCDGTGEVCANCGNAADNCECDDGGDNIVPCPDCDGTGEIED